MDDKDFRIRLARQLTTYALIAIAIVVAIMLVGQVVILTGGSLADSEQRSEDFFEVGRYVLGVILPVVSAWIGTVLAFYFSRENYEAAARSTANLVRQITTSAEKLQATSVRSVMINIAEADTLRLDQEPAAYLLKRDILDRYMTERNRLPILTKDGIAVCVLHKSTVHEFLIARGSAEVAQLTLNDLLTDAKYFAIVRTDGLAFVTTDVNLHEVKRIMDQQPACSDVFVTKDGKPESKVIGWITNALVLKVAQV